MRRNFIFLFLLLFIYQSVFIQHGICAGKKSLEGKKVLMIIAKKDFRDEEFLKPKEVFERNGATVWKTEARRLQSRGAKYTGADLEVDGRIITANGPNAAKKFGEKILEALTK